MFGRKKKVVPVKARQSVFVVMGHTKTVHPHSYIVRVYDSKEKAENCIVYNREHGDGSIFYNVDERVVT